MDCTIIILCSLMTLSGDIGVIDANGVQHRLRAACMQICVGRCLERARVGLCCNGLDNQSFETKYRNCVFCRLEKREG